MSRQCNTTMKKGNGIQGQLRKSSASGGGKSLYLLSKSSKTLSGTVDIIQKRLYKNGINKGNLSG